MIDKTLEENMKKMQDLLKQLEENKDNLDKSIEIYEKATCIYKDLENKLMDYKAKVEVISKNEWYWLQTKACW